MKRFWIILLLLPLFSAAQPPAKKEVIEKQPAKVLAVKKTPVKKYRAKKYIAKRRVVRKTLVKKTPVKKIVSDTIAIQPVEEIPVKPAGGYLITGTVTGYADGTPVTLVNPQNGMPENQAVIRNNKFVLKGNIPFADIKVLLFNNQPPYLNLFLDSSYIIFAGSKENLQESTIAGSPAHNDFINFSNVSRPYQRAFVDGSEYDSALFANAARVCYEYAAQNPSSVIGAVAVLRYFQASDEIAKTEELFNAISPAVKTHPIASYIANQLAAAKSVPVGKLLDDFTQPDTAGIPVSLSSLRGQYVLIDFWASWCGPCRRENPNLVSAFNRFKNKNFTVLGVSLDQNKIPWIDAIKMDQLNWTQVSDLAWWNNAAAKQFGIGSIPQNYLIDPEGKIVGMNLRGAALHKKLARILK